MQKSFLLYLDHMELFSELEDDDAGRLIKIIFKFINDGEQPNIESQIVKMAFIAIKGDLLRNIEKYKSVCNRNKNNGLKGGRPLKNPVGYSETQNNQAVISETQEKSGLFEKPKKPYNDNDNDNDLDNEDVLKEKKLLCRQSPQKKKFVKPTFDELAAYCIERQNNINLQSFLDFYESKGWVVGKSAMKDWKAAVRTWERNGYNGQQKKQGLPKTFGDKSYYGNSTETNELF
jgi:hypothetical protein